MREPALSDLETTWPRFQPAGDRALLVTFGERIDLKTNRQVHAAAAALIEKNFPGIEEIVPGYASILILFDPLVTTWDAIQRQMMREPTSESSLALIHRQVEIPVIYGGEDGPDLGYVASYHQLSIEEVIRIHASRDYPVFFVGFTPGFPYLGGMDPSIATPRLNTPRSRVPGGSVGIAGEQTGIYPVESPGGWQIIGRTALRLFDPHRQPPFLISPGDVVRFVPVHPGDLSSWKD